MFIVYDKKSSQSIAVRGIKYMNIWKCKMQRIMIIKYKEGSASGARGTVNTTEALEVYKDMKNKKSEGARDALGSVILTVTSVLEMYTYMALVLR